MAHTPFQSKRFITFLLIGSLLLFLYLIKDYLVTLTLAVIFTGILYPVYERLTKALKGRRNLSAIIVTISFLLIIIIPSMYLLIEILRQGGEVGEQILPIIQDQLSKSDGKLEDQPLPDWFPYAEQLQPYSEEIISEMTNIVGKISNLIVSSVGSFATSTVTSIVNLFIMLYAVFYFLLNGKRIIHRFAQFLPISESVFNRIKDTLYNTSWATIKGAVVIGLIQGTLVGISFAIVGIPSPMFWGAVAALASLIPSVGCALVYVPAGIYLLATGQHWQGIFVLAWGFLVVGMIDNILRPILVGRSTEISELSILISTLGGITLFGLPGVILGPMIASLFITMSKIYLKENEGVSKPV